MKQFFFFCLILTSTQFAFSQDSGIKKHEIGVGLYALKNTSFYVSDGDIYFKHLPTNNFLNGIFYKYHWSKTAFRVNLNYQFHNFPDEFNSKEASDALYFGSIWNVEVNVGVEHLFGNGKLKPIIAIDIFYQYGENSGASGFLGSPLIDILYYPSPTVSNTGGFSPSLGLSYQILNSLSVRLETAGDIGWYKQQYETFKHSQNSGFYLMYNPVSTISVNFHF